MDRLVLTPAERREITELLDEFEAGLVRFDTPEALQQATILAHMLPARVRTQLNSFRLEQMSGVLRICGHVVDQDMLGPTPRHWRDQPKPSPAHREELLLLMYGSLLGDPFCWATQQDGRLIHDVIPIKGHEREQLGSSSEALLTWHTEDAFHPMRGDFLGFACLRNPDSAATTVGYVDNLDLPDDVRAVLFEERFAIKPDESHLPKNNSESAGGAFSGIEAMNTDPEFVAVLFGDPQCPYMRADPYFMTLDPGDHEAAAALKEFTRAMDDKIFDLVLASGEFCFLDNFRVVHGRKPFKARHDGTDRWLKRINVTSDLRKSRAYRSSGETRAIN
jgi:Fe(II)/alpha-ketoglutarate-dependent arginine beta-hydroxylase